MANYDLYRTYTDSALLSLLQDGEKGAFDEIYDRYWDKLFVVATRRLGDPSEAEEIVQDVMLHLWSRRGSLVLKAGLATYLATAVKYEVINRLVRHQRMQRYQSEATHGEADHSTEQLLELSALEERLALLVKALPEKCRLVFTLSREQGLSQKEIAQHLQISENTVESHLKKALKSLRTGLRQFFFQFFY